MAPRYATAEKEDLLAQAGNATLHRYVASCGTLPVLTLRGEPEALGRQYGALVGAGIQSNAGRLVRIFAEEGLPGPIVERILHNAWERMAPHVPDAFLAEMQGIVSGAQQAGTPLDIDVLRRLVTATNLDMYRREERIAELLDAETMTMIANMHEQTPMQCTFFALWGSRTVAGKMFSMRNLDWLSQTGMHEDRLITVYHPEKGLPFVSMGYAGVIGCLAGMNANGVSFSQIGAFSASEELDGIPWTLLARTVLQTAGNLEKGVDIVKNARHTLGLNYLIADGDPEHFGSGGFRPRAAAFETNHSCCELFIENDPKEAAAVWTDAAGNQHAYGLPITEGIMRADTAFGPDTRALQTADDGPGDPENTGNPSGRDGAGSTYTTCHKPMYDMIRAYETGAEYVFPVRGIKVIEAGQPRKIGVEEALNIAGTVAHNTEMLPENDWNIMSVVYAPTDGQFWVGYEMRYGDGSWKNAPDAGYMQFDMSALLD